VFANKIKRVQGCIDARGHHFQHLLKVHSDFPNALYLLTQCVSLAAGYPLHHSPRIPLTPIYAIDDLEGCFRRKRGTAGYKNMWKVRQEQTLCCRRSGSRCGCFCFDCKLGWMPTVQPVNCLWVHNLFSHCTHILISSRSAHWPAGPSKRTSEHNRDPAETQNTNSPQLTHNRSIWDHSKPLQRGIKHRQSWNYHDLPGIWQGLEVTYGTKIHVWTATLWTVNFLSSPCSKHNENNPPFFQSPKKSPCMSSADGISYLTRQMPLKSEYRNNDIASNARLTTHEKWILPESLECVHRRIQLHIILHQCPTKRHQTWKAEENAVRKFTLRKSEQTQRKKFHILICALCVSSRTTQGSVDTGGNRPLETYGDGG
jgi:hypothetical protein